jgi:myo-inositol-1(or 4)-monophosphatase
MALVGFEATPKIWDIAAGWLLVEEAGGVVRSYGKDHPFPLHPELDYGKKSFPTLIAASEQLAERTIQQILPREKEPK